MPHLEPWDLSGVGAVLWMLHAVRHSFTFMSRDSGELFPTRGQRLVTLCPYAFQGKVHLELRLSEVITDTGVVCHKLATR